MDMRQACLLLNIVICSFSAGAQETREEFKIKEEYYQQRVEDFYTRLALKEREESERQKQAREMKQLRREDAAEKERARQEFIREKHRLPEADPSLWEKENREKELAQERARKEYVRERDQFERFRARLPKIPPEEEYDIFLEDSE